MVSMLQLNIRFFFYDYIHIALLQVLNRQMKSMHEPNYKTIRCNLIGNNLSFIIFHRRYRAELNSAIKFQKL